MTVALVATKFPPGLGRTAKSLPAALDASLNRLGDPESICINTTFPHRGSIIAKLMDGMAAAVDAGKVTAVGVSNYSAQQMRIAHQALARRGIPFASNQVEYSLLHRRPEVNAVLDACEELEVTLIAYQPLASGALTRKYGSGLQPKGLRRFQPIFRGEGADGIRPVIQLLREIAERHNTSPAAVALRWLFGNKQVVPIPGAKTGTQATHNAGALAFALTKAEIEGLRCDPPMAVRTQARGVSGRAAGSADQHRVAEHDQWDAGARRDRCQEHHRRQQPGGESGPGQRRRVARQATTPITSRTGLTPVREALVVVITGNYLDVATVSAERLAEVMVEIADTLVDDFDLMLFLYTLTSHVAELVEASEVGLMVADAQHELQFVAASQEMAMTLELFELQTREGPCLDAFRTGVRVVNVDLSTAAGRWPEFAPRAVAAGFGVVHALPMRLRDEVIGGLNVFTAPGRTVDVSELTIVQALVDVATISLLQERALQRATVLSAQLQAALSSRVAIEQAKGALAQIHGTSVDAAFEILRSYARGHHHKISDLARDCVARPDRFPQLMLAGPDTGRDWTRGTR